MADNVLFGFVGLEHLFAERVTEVDVRVINTALAQSLDEHNRITNGLLSAMVDRTTERTRRFTLPGTGELQPLDEWGNPLPTRPAGYYTVGFPIQGGGDAHGDNRVTRALMTVQELNRHVIDIQERDARWLRRHALAALLDNASWTFADPAGDVTVQPLANGDTVTYNVVGGSFATDDHYLAGTAVTADKMATIRRELTEHLSNAGGGPIIAYANGNFVDELAALDEFVEVGDPDINEGANSDVLVGQLERGFGDEVVGKIARVWLVEWSALPDDYLVAHQVGRTPLAMREYPSAALQGLFRESHSPNGNLNEERYIRYAGFGVQDRTAAVVWYKGDNTTYAVPAAFNAPLAV